MNNKPKEGAKPAPVSKEANKAKKSQKNKKKVQPPHAKFQTLPKRVTSAGQAENQYAYQDDVTEEDPIKERHVTHTIEYTVENIATPGEMAEGHAATGVDKGVAAYFVPPAKNTLGTFVGKKEVSSEFHNDSDQTIIIAGAWCKNWSEQMDTIDTVEPFRLEIPPMSSKKTTCKKQWNWPMFAADQSEQAPARYLMMRYYVHGSDAWSEKFKATDLTSVEGIPTLLEKMKHVTAYRRVDSVHYYTIGGASDDESPTDLLAYGTFYEFSDIHLINGTEPYPPMPYKMHTLTGRVAGTSKQISFFGQPLDGYKERSPPTYNEVVVDFAGTEKLGLGVFPVDYYDDVYGWGGMLMLVMMQRSNIDDDTKPEPWKNTYTTPDMSDNSDIEWELPCLGSLTKDETNADMASVGGRFKYSTELGCYVLWDYMRGKPSLIGSGYDTFSGNYIFFGPKCFTGPKTIIKGVLSTGFKRDGADEPKVKIAWGAIFAVVSTIIEVLYVATQALGNHYKRDEKMLKYIDPKKYQDSQLKITRESADKLNAFLDKQERDKGRFRPHPRHSRQERDEEEHSGRSERRSGF